jgi:hypothetical protein
MDNLQTNEEVNSEEELPEYRIYVESNAGTPIVAGLHGQEAMEAALELAMQQYPDEALYVREVTEQVVIVARPAFKGGKHTITTF